MRWRVSPKRASVLIGTCLGSWIGAAGGRELVRWPHRRGPDDLAERDDELLELVLDEEVVGEEDRPLVEVDPFQRDADVLRRGAHVDTVRVGW